MLTKEKYKEYKSWSEKYTDKVSLKKISYGESWNVLFKKLFLDKRIENIENKLQEHITKKELIFPKPHFLFNTFRLTEFDKVKVVIIGQDPYFEDEDSVPQAMGLSFSVPFGITVPSSLKNIYSNLIKFGNIKKIPKHGNLEKWASQGCIMLNSALTVTKGNKNIHQDIWRWFTNEVIKYISENKEHVVFVLWGSDAYSKLNLIDLDKHEAVISSHPSGLSANKPMKEYSAFNDLDSFGQVNKYLKKWNLEVIDWNL